MKKSNIEDLRIVYLDQFALSNMAGEPSPEWSKIKELLFENFKSKKILCPFSLEFYSENSQLKKEKAYLIEKEFYPITGGYCFKPELAIYSQEITSKLRGNRITKKTYLVEMENSTFQFDENQYKEHRKINNYFSENAILASEESNQLAADYHHVKLEKKVKDKLSEGLINENIEDFLNRLSQLIKSRYLIPEAIDTPLGEMESWIDMVLSRLTYVHRMSLKELIKLKNILINQGFSRFPSLDTRFKLFSLISVNNKKTMPNDFIDLMRISTGFSISDIFLTDKQRKNEIIELKFPEKYNTRVYSGTKSDLDLIIADLEKIKTTPNNELS